MKTIGIIMLVVSMVLLGVMALWLIGTFQGVVATQKPTPDQLASGIRESFWFGLASAGTFIGGLVLLITGFVRSSKKRQRNAEVTG